MLPIMLVLLLVAVVVEYCRPEEVAPLRSGLEEKVAVVAGSGF